jgi:formamidopyrimidine-DNA glycosylase
MPELPEVETMARLIRPRIEGRTLWNPDVLWVRTLGGMSRPAFARAVEGSKVARVWRRAKWIVIDLEQGKRPAGHLFIHLRMTGRLLVTRRSEPAGAYDRVRLDLSPGKECFVFTDVRKFGRLLFAEDLEAVLRGLGPEPLGEEFTEEWFARALRTRKRLLKPLLLDQSFVAGLGNIYVDESLHRARLHPERSSERVSKQAASRLWSAIREVLTEAIEHEGSSFDTFYRTPEGNPGAYQDQFRVYGRDGKPCRTCGSEIRKIVVGQRGTHLCRRCQPTPRRTRRDAGLPTAR